MNNLVKSILIFVLLIFLHNCSTDNNPIQTEINEDDLNIKNMLLGKWQFYGSVRQFNDDGTFFDSTYADIISRHPGVDPPIVCTELDSNGLFLNRVVYGKYQVKNGILKLQPIDNIIDCSPLGSPACYIYFDQFVEISNDTLELKTIFNWQSTSDNTQDIWGSWESNYWVWAYHEDLPPGGAPQLVRDSIKFYQDSTIFHQKIVGLPYSGILWRKAFTYDSQILYVILGNEKYYVSFDKNIMKWLETGFTYKYIRK